MSNINTMDSDAQCDNMSGDDEILDHIPVEDSKQLPIKILYRYSQFQLPVNEK